MPYGVIRICYNSYQTKPTDHYKVELFRALLAKGQEHTAYLMKSKCRPTDKENAARICEEWRRAEAEV